MMMLFQANLSHFHSRKLLLHAPTVTTGMDVTASSPAPAPYAVNKSFDANVVMVLSVLLCALVCSLCLNSIIRCVLRCSNLVYSDPMITSQESRPARLVNTGIKKKALKAFLTVSYQEGMKLPGMDKECVICLSEFVLEERVKILPKCNHGFHVRCIDKWLSSHSSCPTCRHSLVETCQKILSGGACSNITPPQNHQQNAGGGVLSNISIVPLQREPFVQRNEI